MRPASNPQNTAPFDAVVRPAPEAKEPAITSHELMAGRSELAIIHDGRRYTLRITRNRKLILTA